MKLVKGLANEIQEGVTEGAGKLFSLEKGGEPYCHLHLHERMLLQEGVGFSSQLTSDGMKWFQTVNGEVQIGHQEEFLHGQGSQVVEQAAQGASSWKYSRCVDVGLRDMFQ